MDTLLQILQWAIPSGGIGAAIAWIANKNARQAKTAKEVHDTYKVMYADVSELLKKVQTENEKSNEKLDELGKENERTRRALNRLSRAIEAIQLCPHRATCPVRSELSLTEDDDKHSDSKCSNGGQHGKREKMDGNRDSSEERGDSGDSGGQPP